MPSLSSKGKRSWDHLVMPAGKGEGDGRTRWCSFADLGSGSSEAFSRLIFMTYEMIMIYVLLLTPFLGIFKTQQTSIYFSYRSGRYLSILVYVFLGEEHWS